MHAFDALMDTLIAAPQARKPAVEQMILDTFQRRKAVLALDMSGFTLTVRRDGILAYLCQIRRMHKITKPLVLGELKLLLERLTQQGKLANTVDYYAQRDAQDSGLDKIVGDSEPCAE